MKKGKISPAMRCTLLFSATVIWIGIWQTGFGKAFWILYLPATLFTFAAATGICPGLIFFKTLLREK